MTPWYSRGEGADGYFFDSAFDAANNQSDSCYLAGRRWRLRPGYSIAAARIH